MLPVWPLPALPDGRAPAISSGFRHRNRPSHNGADMLYPTAPGDPRYPGKYTADRSRAYYSGPLGVPVLAAEDGVVVQSADKSRINGDVWVHHEGSGLVTRYAHMVRGSRAVKVGDRVVAGQRLGTMGAGAGTPLRHLHFEVLTAGRKNSQQNPAPLLRGAEVVPWTLARSRELRSGPTRTVVRPGEDDDKARGESGWLWVLLMVVGVRAFTRR